MRDSKVDLWEVTGLEANDVLGFAIERASAINTYWNLYIAVATGVVGIMASGREFSGTRSIKVFITVAFVIFALSNLNAIIRLAELRQALLETLPATMENREAIVASLSPAKWWQYTAFHIVLDAVVIAAIWLVPWRSLRD
jgi:hypothetical protein